MRERRPAPGVEAGTERRRGCGMREETCADCGEVVRPGDQFCVCGAYLDWAGRTPAEHPDGTAERDRIAPPDGPAVPRWLTAEPAPRAEPGCPNCGATNPPERRFCGHCGHGLVHAPNRFRPPTLSAASRPWWWPFGRRRSAAERAARQAFRRSLPVRYWIYRLATVLVVTGLVAVLAVITRGDPVGWARDRWYDVRGVPVPVPVASVALDPAVPERPQFEARLAVDAVPATAWGTAWIEGTVPSGTCGTTRTTTALLLTFPAAADVRAVRLIAGLPTGDGKRLQQWRPKQLELRFSDGSCQSLPVTDAGAEQTLTLAEPVSTTEVRVDVVDVYPRPDGGSDVVAISEIVVLQRPPG
jgi:hypothetical protein